MRPLAQLLPGWLESGLGLAFPPVCQVCSQGRATARENYVCADCRASVKFIHPPYCRRCGRPFDGAITTPFECGNCRGLDLSYDSARSAVEARGVVLEAIHKYKYNRAMCFEPFLANLLIQQARLELRPADWDALVPIPLNATKRREREFNQAERLARRLGAAIGIPVETNVVRRVKPTRSQTLLSREARVENVRRAFATPRRVRLDGRRLVLIDDVFTTGATTDACARALRQAGAAQVCVWTVARGT